MIYVVWATKTPYVKIGYTRQAPADRVASFRTGCPHQLELLYTTKGNRDLESFLHTKLAAIQCPGGKEWFDLRGLFSDVPEIDRKAAIRALLRDPTYSRMLKGLSFAFKSVLSDFTKDPTQEDKERLLGNICVCFALAGAVHETLAAKNSPDGNMHLLERLFPLDPQHDYAPVSPTAPKYSTDFFHL